MDKYLTRLSKTLSDYVMALAKKFVQEEIQGQGQEITKLRYMNEALSRFIIDNKLQSEYMDYYMKKHPNSE